MIDWAEKKLGVWVLTPHGMTLANQVKQALPHTDLFASKKLVPGEFYTAFSSLAKALAPVWDHYDAHYFIMATGIVVRTIAPLIQDKIKDPAVVCGDEAGSFVISLVSGHIGGANELAVRLSTILGATPVITTATDVNQVPAIDVIARDQGLYIENKTAIKHVSMAFIKGEPLPVHDPFHLVSPHLPPALMEDPSLFTSEKSGIWVDCTIRDLPEKVLVLRPKMLVAGMGCRKGVPRQELEDHLRHVFQTHGFSVNSLSKIVSVDLKAEEPGLLALARTLNVPIEFYTRDELDQVKTVPNPSFLVNKHIGVRSVCEAAAMLATGRTHLLIPKTSGKRVTFALAVMPVTS
ncbi:cobalamin biosynthesis protein CbiG [Desulfobacter hydrogenophilus]|uniref:Cobalamin biosynthesis protein CbiG n=1 Tax=Desulfobacter hydrogenophilus TaxID=2291 RepID=A0A328FHX7_9BACT|nr:cobalt-precorrin 5A hydrolase [Desulfobacter hydrogenophilus]NDY71263.1 cobalt-precorrin 5A hydrolase [Desulfobacter hydrogenophilus]QBH15000.1 cobalamin biosynthesis protein CbiG [Desulfobacter hydrogenophilus]RAM02753.1 cobalamin biosynthesis protein CbiG [Desulfobacter hydrogenophilus]